MDNFSVNLKFKNCFECNCSLKRRYTDDENKQTNGNFNIPRVVAGGHNILRTSPKLSTLPHKKIFLAFIEFSGNKSHLSLRK